jgi:CheY-like chemotaxis protein
MDGYEACKAVRDADHEAQQRTPIIALTANAMASDEHKCLHAGMDAFLTKPINQDYMIQVILQTVVPHVSQKASSNSRVPDLHSTEVLKNSYSPKLDLRVPVK